MSRSLLRRGLWSLVAVSLTCQVPLALAQNQTPNELADLVGARAAGAERDLESRGYVNHHGAKSGDASYTYWWSSARKHCVRVRTADGRYEQVAQVSNSDCNQKDPDAGPSTGAKVAIGAAALLGVVALAHKSHHREDRRYDERQSADFERGFRDALYNHPYHNYGNAREYNEGYTAGSDERREQSSYRHGSEYTGGYRAKQDVREIRNRDTRYAWDVLQRKGFRLAGERRLGGNRNQWFYWNPSTRQCVEIRTRGDDVESLKEAEEYACN